jgi:threonyl-tRNA synthetase
MTDWNPELLPRTVGALFRGQLWELCQPLNNNNGLLLNHTTDQQNDTLTFLSVNNTLVAPFYTGSAAMILGKALSLEYPNDIIAGSIDTSSKTPNFAYDYMLLPSLTSGDSVKSQLQEILASTKEINDCYQPIAQLLKDTNVRHISEHDLKTLTKRVNSIVNAGLPIERIDVPLATAIDLLSNDPLKVYYIRYNYGTRDDVIIPLYRIGDYIDIAPGPLLPRTDLLQHIILTAVSAKHWWAERDKAQAKQQITRVRGVSFATALQYQQWRQSQEEAHKRDHRVIGTNQQLFHFDVNSPGGPFFLPHGTRIVERLFSFLRSEYRRFGYDEVMTPMIYKKSLWEQSGHWQNYAEDMFAVRGGLPDTTSSSDNRSKAQVDWYGLKPMNCPAHCLIYASQPRTANELPLRLADFGSLHR